MCHSPDTQRSIFTVVESEVCVADIIAWVQDLCNHVHSCNVMQEDWEPMLSKTGFKLQTIYPTRGSFRILLAEPV